MELEETPLKRRPLWGVTRLTIEVGIFGRGNLVRVSHISSKASSVVMVHPWRASFLMESKKTPMRMSHSSSIEVDILERDDLMRDVYAPHHKLFSIMDV
ncbi:Hypothetical predicted protein, partial [Olea europaea subsp. europaea]